MSKTLIVNPNTKGRKKLLKKFVKDIEVSNRFIRGQFSVVGYRKYSYYTEVDIAFKGQIYVRFKKHLDWYNPQFLVERGGSVVRINRMVRKKIIDEISINLRCFSVDIGHYSAIKKLKYI